MIFWTRHSPDEFFHAVLNEDMLALGRLFPKDRTAIEACDVHDRLAATDRARLSEHTPFR
jgi:hypothetical protein